MPLHLLGKKSWNVYNPANIARVKADEAAAAAREAADEQRMQELDAERRAAILRGHTPPPLPDEAEAKGSGRRKDGDCGRESKKRKLAGEDDTDMAIRLAKAKTAPRGDDANNARILKLRNEKSEAPLTDHAGHIDLFPVDVKEAVEREKNAEVEQEKKRKERALEDQYTMRFSNAAGRDGAKQAWYTAHPKPDEEGHDKSSSLELSAFEGRDVWGNEDPLRKEREKARILSNDPFVFMQQAQRQLQKSKEEKKKRATERERELRDSRAMQEQDDRKDRRRERRYRVDHNASSGYASSHRDDDKSSSKKHKRRHRSRSRSRDKHDEGRKHHERDSRHSHSHRGRSRSPRRSRDKHGRGYKDHDREKRHKHSSPR